VSYHFTKKYWDKKVKIFFYNFETQVSMHNQGKLLKNLMYLVLCFLKSIPGCIDIHGRIIYLFTCIAISFHCNIVQKNIMCDMSLKLVGFFTSH